METIKINWPNKKSSNCPAGIEWLKAAHDANIEIPTGCLVGSCGACEIEVNGEVIRAFSVIHIGKLNNKNVLLFVLSIIFFRPSNSFNRTFIITNFIFLFT